MSKPNDKISGSLRLAWVVVIFALITAIGFALDLAWHRFSGLMFLICALGLTTVAIAEVLFWHQSASAWHERRPVAAMLAACVALACSAGTLYTNYSTSAIGQDTKSAEKLTAFNKSDDLDKAIHERQERIAQLDKQLQAGPARTADAAQADIDKAMAHKWWAATSQCTITKGPQTRDFCAAYQAAVADKSNASAGVQAKAERTNLANELTELRTKRGSTEQVASKDNPAIAMLIAMGLSDEHAHVADSMVLPGVIQIIMALGGILLANEHARGREPKPWLPRWFSDWAKSKAYVAATGRHMSAADEYAAAQASPSPAVLRPQAPVSRVEIGIKQPTLLEKWKQQQGGAEEAS